MIGKRLAITLMASAAALAVAMSLAADRRSEEENVERDPLPVEVASLGYTARVEFKIVHPEDTPTFFTHTTGGEFVIRHDILEPNHEHSLRIEGNLTEDDGELLLRYEVEASHADLNEGFEAVHSANGSAFLVPDESRTLTLLGDAAFQVTVTRED